MYYLFILWTDSCIYYSFVVVMTYFSGNTYRYTYILVNIFVWWVLKTDLRQSCLITVYYLRCSKSVHLPWIKKKCCRSDNNEFMIIARMQVQAMRGFSCDAALAVTHLVVVVLLLLLLLWFSNISIAQNPEMGFALTFKDCLLVCYFFRIFIAGLNLEFFPQLHGLPYN